MEESSEIKIEKEFIDAYDEYAEAIFRYCVYRVYDRERAKELMQECFANTWQYLREGKEVKNLRAFLYKVAHNLCVNEAIRHKAQSLDYMKEEYDFDLEDGAKSPEDNVEIGLLLKNLEMLESEARELLKLRYVDDLKVADIAGILGLLPNTVSVKIKRAEDALKKMYPPDASGS